MSDPTRELTLTRLIDSSPEVLYRAWTDADLLKKWFCPAPWTVAEAVLDVRNGGANKIVMQSPEGELFPNTGIYLEVVPNRKVVWTDAFVGAWEPSEKAFLLAEISFEPEAGKTRYTARVRHWSVADREAHEKMGFYEGWGKATDQLEALVATL